MKYRRALLLAELGVDVGPAVASLGRVAPTLERVLLVVRLPTPMFGWLTEAWRPERSEDAPDAATVASIEVLREAAAALGSVELRLVPDLSALALVELAADVDLLVAGARSLRNAAVLVDAARRLGQPVLWPDDAPRADHHDAPIREVACVAFASSDRVSIRAFLRDHGNSSLHVTVLAPEGAADVDVVRGVAGIEAEVERGALPELMAVGRWLEEMTRDRVVDLLVLPRIASALLAVAPWPAPVLLLPALPTPTIAPGTIDLADLVEDDGVLRARIDWAAFELTPVAEQVVAFVAEGRVVATALTSRAGEAELPAGPHSLGVFRLGAEPPADPLVALEQMVTVVRPADVPVVLFDAMTSDDALRARMERADANGHALLAVRLRPTRSCRSIRDRLRELGLPARVLDARAVLDEGEALDVSEANDPVRLARVAARLRALGFVVAEPALHSRATPIAGNRIDVELDNAMARRWLLDTIAESTATLHLQVYMAHDDDVGRQVEAALAAAAARGVTVRVLVDSLHGKHGSFGVQNPLLARLASRPGVQLRVSRPITELPSLEDLKGRDHRKIVVADGRLALIGGRNLSHEYYTGFAEMPLTPKVSWREVPWLDAGARVEGPAVAAIAASFREAWVRAGGASFEVATPRPVGPTSARVLVHRGLRDATTLDGYRELIDGARSHLYVVNGFPLALELQHALLGAVRRGVRVVQLVGHLTPTHGGRPFEGPWSSARMAATEFVHSRSDVLIDAGAEVYHFAVGYRPGWDPALGTVHPHVHAKLVSVDGARFAVGSANLDITSAYWESELMIVVEDAALTRGLESHLDTLLAGSIRVQRDDPKWKQHASRRAWMRHWPGVLAF